LTFFGGMSVIAAMNAITNLTAKQLRQAANLTEKIASLQSELDQLLGGSTTTKAPAAVSATPRKKNKISAAGLAKIRAAQKKRWAKVNALKGAKPAAAAAAKPAKKSRAKLSPAAKAQLSAKLKAAWAARKAAKK
jgi:hypothetical protein